MPWTPYCPPEKKPEPATLQEVFAALLSSKTTEQSRIKLRLSEREKELDIEKLDKNFCMKLTDFPDVNISENMERENAKVKILA